MLLLGDFVLDKYQFGSVERISPEAPVPVLKLLQEKYLPGGAGNVVLNLQSMSASVVAIGRVGRDSEGDKLLTLLSNQGINTSGIVKQKEYPTSTKTRFIAQSQQLLRVDREDNIPLTKQLQQVCLEQVDKELSCCDIVAISDYNKGFFSPGFLLEIISLANSLGKRVIVDPKGCDFAKYRGAFLIKPNEKEAIGASPADKQDSLFEAVDWLRAHAECNHLLVTRSSKGMSLISQEEALRHFPTHCSEVIDVTGAGDTVLSMLVVALAADVDLHAAIALANLAAGESLKHIGCYAPTLKELKQSASSNLLATR